MVMTCSNQNKRMRRNLSREMCDESHLLLQLGEKEEPSLMSASRGIWGNKCI
jgi:hypothetical protein